MFGWIYNRMKPKMAYCVKCRSHQPVRSVRYISVNHRCRMVGICKSCKHKISKFVKPD